MICSQLEVGKIINTHGVKGEVKVVPWTNTPEQFENFDWVYIKKDSHLKKVHIEDIKYQKNNIILRFKQIHSLDEAELYKNSILVVDREVMGEPPEGEYYICDLLGMQVKNEQGEILGNLEDVISTGSNDVYVVKNNLNKEILVPALKDVILDVDLGNNIMVVKLPEGLIE